MGLKPGQRIISVDGKPVRTQDDLVRRLDSSICEVTPLNTTIEYQVQAVKGKNKMKLRVVNLESDDDEPTPPPK